MWQWFRESPQFVSLDDVDPELPAVMDEENRSSFSDRQHDWFRDALGQLIQIQQNVIRRKLAGQSVAEIGRALRLTRGDLKGVQVKAVRRLKSAAVA